MTDWRKKKKQDKDHMEKIGERAEGTCNVIEGSQGRPH